jgi:fatty-acyl-CoA synthase
LGDDGKPIPHDGQTPGELQYRGPWVTAGYYLDEQATKNALTDDGWFRSGDICTVDEHGFLQLVDRSKDVVKSGGEWISSVDLENAIMGHPEIKEAAVVGVAHDQWIERPIAVVTLRDGSSQTEESIREWLGSRVARWWLPDRIVFVDAIPQTGVGKFLKRELRQKYIDILRNGA